MYDTNMEEIDEETIAEENRKMEEKKESRTSLDPYEDIRRLDAILKKLTIRFKKCANKENDELMVKIANAIGLMTSKKTDIAFIVLGVEELVKGKPHYRPK